MDGLLAIAAGALGIERLAGMPVSISPPAGAVDSLMSAAAAQFPVTKAYLDGIGKQIKAIAEGTKVPKGHMTDQECQKTLQLVGAVVAVVVAIVVAIVVSVFTFGAGAANARKISSARSSVDNWAANLHRQGKTLPEITASVARIRKLLDNARDATAALDFFVHVAKDKAHANKLLDAVRSRNGAAVREIIRRDVPGSMIDVSEVKEEAGILITFRINTITHCLRTFPGCDGKITTR